MDVTQLKTIHQIPQVDMDCWQVAAHIYGQTAVDADHLLAGKAFRQMEAAGWTFVDYDIVTGEEIWRPLPTTNEAFMPEARNYKNLIETTMQFQIVREYAAGLDFCYAQTAEQAETIKKEFMARGPHVGRNNNRVSVEILERGEFVPHYKYDE